MVVVVAVMVLGGGGNGGGLKIWIWLNDDEKPVMKWVGVVYSGGGSGGLVGEFRLGLDLGFCLVLDGDGGGVARDGDGCLVGEKSGFLF
ncbi:hypothetical protein Q3G72_022118 [Acer saccharum]|nr:hypothetical protein Q3G72_022118 [Acer saccharum]